MHKIICSVARFNRLIALTSLCATNQTWELEGRLMRQKAKITKIHFFFKKLYINVMLLTLLHSKCSTDSRRSPYLWLEWSWFTSPINSIQRVALNKYSRWMHLSIPRLIWKLQFSSHPFIFSVIDITCIDITIFTWLEGFARVNTVTIK